MTIDATQLWLNKASSPSGGAAATAPAASFRDLVDPKDFAQDRPKLSRSDQALQAARDAVAVNLIEPILAQSHQDPFKVDMFHGGQAETMFQQRMDQVLATRLTQRTNMPVVDAIYRKLMQREARGAAPAAAGGVNLHA
jgi:hypothetical protein